MKMPNRLITCGTTALFAAALSLQAQTSGAGTGAAAGTSAGTGASSAGASTSQSMPSSSPQTSSSFGSSTSSFGSSASATTPSSGSTYGTQNSTTAPTSAPSQTFDANGSAAGSASGSAAGSFSGSMNTAPTTSNTASAYSGSTYGTQSTSSSQQFGTASTQQQQYGSQANQTNVNGQYSTGTQTNVAAGGGYATSDTAVTTFVQQLDAQGPAIVQRASGQLGDLACSQDTVQNLVEALHSGKSVTITANGQSSTFNASGAHMGYGEAYLALALAGQELRNAGVTTCATPEQWNAVLMGGPLQVTNTSTSTNSSASASASQTLPGIVTLRNQGQGWGQIAQSANVQLGQIVSSSDFSANTSTNANAAGAPTGFSSAEMNQGHADVNAQDNGNHKGEKKHHWWNRKDKDEKKDENSNTNDNSFTPSTPSTHADNSANPSDR